MRPKGIPARGGIRHPQMLTLSVRQPWASLIAWGDKTIEHRSWSTTYRGPLLIHASAHQFVADDGEGERLLLPYSVIVARVELVTVREFLNSDCKAAGMGEFVPGFAWVLAHPVQLVPVHAKGKLHLWDFGGEVRELPVNQCHVEAWRAARSGVVA